MLGPVPAPLAEKRHRVAIVWRGDRETRRIATAYNNRYRAVFEELLALGATPRPRMCNRPFR
jgi:hypothetical protein